MRRRSRKRHDGRKLTVDPRKVAFGILISTLLFLLFVQKELFVRSKYVVGEVFDRDIYAWRTVEYISMTETQRRREEAMRAVKPIYRQAHDATERVLQSVELAYKQLRKIASSSASYGEKLRRAKMEVILALDDSVLSTCLRASPDVLALMESYTISLVQRELDKGIKPTEEDLERARASIWRASKALNLRSPYRDVVAAIAVASIQPNLIQDAKATQEIRERVMNAVPPVRRVIRAGDLIARMGEVVTEEHVEKLRALGANYISIAAAAMLSILLTCLAGLGIKSVLDQHAPLQAGKDMDEFKRLKLVVTIWLPLLVIQCLLLFVGAVESAVALISTAAMVTCVLLEAPALAIFLSAFACVVVGIVVLRDPSMFVLRAPISLVAVHATPVSAILYAFGLIVISFVCSIVGTYLVRSANQRAQFLYAGICIGLLTFFGRLLLYALIGPMGVALPLQKLLTILAYEMLIAAATALAVSALTLAMVSILERVFGLLTAFRLLELANTSTGLLRELAERAPGTYQSSLMVAALARAAAEAVGANPMLAYVGGLYHDIGKLRRPNYFAENMRGQENPHEKMTPTLSASILREHVEEGVMIAREHGLPERIIDFVREHHGTSVMQFFYAKALGNGREDVDEVMFRYPGPKPRSKETAIVMLADAVEAAVSAQPEEDFKTPDGWERIERLIEKVIRDRIADGQLEEAPLTYAEIKRIQEVFKEHLRVSKLQRLQYPEVVREGNGGKGQPSNRSNSVKIRHAES